MITQRPDTHRSFTWFLALVLSLTVLAVAAFLLLLLAIKPVQAAAIFNVDTFADSIDANPGNGICADPGGFCSLRAAIMEANALAGDDEIQLPAGTYALTISGQFEEQGATGDLDVNPTVGTDVLRILGQGASSTIIDAGDLDRVLDVVSGAVVLGDLTLQHGISPIPSSPPFTDIGGGGVRIAASAIVTTSGVTIQNNRGEYVGGGILVAGGELYLEQSRILNNTVLQASGAIRIESGSTVTILGSTISGHGPGEGFYESIYNGGTLVISATAVIYNAGGIYNEVGGILDLLNVTVSGNDQFGLEVSGGNVTVAHSTLANNGSYGIDQYGGSVSLYHALLASNTFGNCAGTITSNGYNLSSDASCGLGGAVDLESTDPILGPLADNGGPTLTHELQTGSPAIDVGDPGFSGPPFTDQRGLGFPRVAGAGIDIGAFEVSGDAPQSGPTFSSNALDDVDDGTCGLGHCSLREAIAAANALPNVGIEDVITFDALGPGNHVIQVTGPLPGITEAIILDASTDPSMTVTLDGSLANAGADGLTLTGGGSTVRGLAIDSFDGSGIVLDAIGGNLIENNDIRNAGGAGVRVLSGSGNRIQGNTISGNGGPAIDLGNDGFTANDFGDADDGPNDLLNKPELARAYPALINLDTGAFGTRIQGQLKGLPAATTYNIQLFASATCGPASQGHAEVLLSSFDATTNAQGLGIFQHTLSQQIPLGWYITATATDPSGNTSELGGTEKDNCLPVGYANDSWTRSYDLPLVQSFAGVSTATIDQFLDQPGQSRWYRFQIEPESQVIVTLSNLPANYDLTIYRDIAATFQNLTTPEDVEELAKLSAEFAPDIGDGWSPDVGDGWSPDIGDGWSPDLFSPDVFSPDIGDGWSPDIGDGWSPDIGDGWSPDIFSPDVFSPDVGDGWSPDIGDGWSPDVGDGWSPDVGDGWSPDIGDGWSPDIGDGWSPEAFSSAQLRSLVGVSAYPGTTSEGIVLRTWQNTGYFYVRVRGRNGAYNVANSFQLETTLLSGSCSNAGPITTPSDLVVGGSSFRTLILHDVGRMSTDPAQQAAVLAKLQELAGRPEVAGAVVDLATVARVAAANQQADNPDNLACPYAKNLVALETKTVVDAYRAANPDMEYLVLVGSDDVIPFFRQPDRSDLAQESNFIPPVRDNSPSQASLKLDYVLSQDRYGSSTEISIGVEAIPLPDLAVGRLVETPAEVITMVDAYLATVDGVMPTPASALVTGYDFIGDAASAIRSELELGIDLGPGGATALIAPRDASPLDPISWTGEQLKTALLGSRQDIVFLGGHFSAYSALAADWNSRLWAYEVASSTVDMTNALIFSIGCHSGYNIVNVDGVPGIEILEPDWAQAFARKGAVLIAGTGYQYGNTDFIKYNEQLYLYFSQELRRPGSNQDGSGPISIGQALLRAKQSFLADQPKWEGLHTKSVMEVTLFGLPMLSVDMPGQRLDPTGNPPEVTGLTSYTEGQPAVLGLSRADVSVSVPLTEATKVLTSVLDIQNPVPATVVATYFEGPDGVVSIHNEPVLPLDILNVSAPAPSTKILRGVGFRGGSYVDHAGIFPLTSAATTEIRGVHKPFLSDVFYPVQPWFVNYMDRIIRGPEGEIRLMLTPAQFQSVSLDSINGTWRTYSGMDFRLFYSDNTIAINTTDSSLTYVPALVSPPDVVRVEAAEGQNGQFSFTATVIGAPEAGIAEVWVTYTVCDTNGACDGSWRTIDLVQNLSNTLIWEGSEVVSTAEPANINFMVQAVNGVGLVGLAHNGGTYYQVGVDPASMPPVGSGGGGTGGGGGGTGTPPPLAATLTLQPATTSGAYNTSQQYTAVLADASGPLPGQRVTISLGKTSRRAVTDASGQVVVDLPLNRQPGQYQVVASFSGSSTHLASSAAGTVTIVKQATALTIDPATPTSVQYSDGLFSAELLDAVGNSLREKTVFFVATEGGASVFAQPDVTNFGSLASQSGIPLPAGSYDLAAYFSGSIPLPTGLISLNDSSYLPSVSAFVDLTVTPEDATLSLLEATAIGATGYLTTSVTQVDDGSPGDITLAQVQFNVISGTQVISTVAPVDANGLSTAIIGGLETGTYQVEAVVTGGYYISSPSGQVELNVISILSPAIVALDTNPAPAALGSPISITASFTHANVLESNAATWDWGDGGTSTCTAAGSTSDCQLVESAGEGTVIATHAYTEPGVYTIVLTLEDSQGHLDQVTYQYVVVYDPNGGFVTGGGWIDSQPEACPVFCNGASGKAKFGFVSKYKRGQSVPTGKTEFKFKAGDLDFRSDLYQWLVVAGAKAMFKGDGTINGQDGYSFLISAIDEDLTSSTEVDLFRIKIWDRISGDVIYDNNWGAPDDGDPATAIGGGSIVIHRR